MGELGIKYVKEEDYNLVGFVDKDWASSFDDWSTSRYIFCLGTQVISWSSEQRRAIKLSSAEADYTTTIEATCERSSLVAVNSFIFAAKNFRTYDTIYCDNMSTKAMAKNRVFDSRSKYIKLRHHFIHDVANKGEIC